MLTTTTTTTMTKTIRDFGNLEGLENGEKKGLKSEDNENMVVVVMRSGNLGNGHGLWLCPFSGPRLIKCRIRWRKACRTNTPCSRTNSAGKCSVQCVFPSGGVCSLESFLAGVTGSTYQPLCDISSLLCSLEAHRLSPQLCKERSIDDTSCIIHC